MVLAVAGDKIEMEGITNEKFTSTLEGKKLVILDGLQRTNTLLDLEEELLENGNTESLDALHKKKIRVEIYNGLNKLGILYRMLTLNTGQTPMSLRHQIEILYSNYAGSEISGVKLLKEVDEEKASGKKEYSFREMVDGFKAYLTRSEAPIDRIDLLDNITDLEELSKEQLGQKDLFTEFVLTFNDFVLKVDGSLPNWVYEEKETESELVGEPFGSTIPRLFARSQSMTGFGCAIGKLKDYKKIENIGAIREHIKNLKPVNKTSIYQLISKLDEIKNTSKKIGSAQRLYFLYFYRELFNKDNEDAFLDINKAVNTAYDKYLSQNV